MEIFEVQEGSFLLTPFLTSHVRDTVTERLPYPSLRTPTSHVFIGRMGYCCAFGALGSFLKVIWGDVLQRGWTVGCHFRLIRPARPPNPRPVVPVLSYFYLTFLKYSQGEKWHRGRGSTLRILILPGFLPRNSSVRFEA